MLPTFALKLGLPCRSGEAFKFYVFKKKICILAPVLVYMTTFAGGNGKSATVVPNIARSGQIEGE